MGFLIQVLDNRESPAGSVVGFPEVISDGRKLADPLTPECQARSLQELANPPVLTSLRLAILSGQVCLVPAVSGWQEGEWRRRSRTAWQGANKQPQKQWALPPVGVPCVGKGCPSSSLSSQTNTRPHSGGSRCCDTRESDSWPSQEGTVWALLLQ